MLLTILYPIVLASAALAAALPNGNVRPRDICKIFQIFDDSQGALLGNQICCCQSQTCILTSGALTATIKISPAFGVTSSVSGNNANRDEFSVAALGGC
ncbi:hypothetical protein CcaCcLH18_14292 [Colletotrichum camelliae]|nr:hypothetical protein CcaCcLH18_14292 [Colletotrichum camelliae]